MYVYSYRPYDCPIAITSHMISHMTSHMTPMTTPMTSHMTLMTTPMTSHMTLMTTPMTSHMTHDQSHDQSRDSHDQSHDQSHDSHDQSHEHAVRHLLQFEDVVDKELLQVFVAEVDAELLKTVGLKRFKTKDVQHSNRETLLATVLL